MQDGTGPLAGGGFAGGHGYMAGAEAHRLGRPPHALSLGALPVLLLLCQEGSSSEEEIASEEEDCETMTLPEMEQAEEKMEEEEEMLEKYRQERQEEMFPDEVDTPRDVPARVR